MILRFRTCLTVLGFLRFFFYYFEHFFSLKLFNLFFELKFFEFFSQLHIPPFASSLHFELYKSKDGEKYVQIFYRKSQEENLSPMNIPKCGEKCSLDKLYDLYNAIMPGDHQTECGLQPPCNPEM